MGYNNTKEVFKRGGFSATMIFWIISLDGLVEGKIYFLQRIGNFVLRKALALVFVMDNFLKIVAITMPKPLL